jgi:hypothetical protein
MGRIYSKFEDCVFKGYSAEVKDPRIEKIEAKRDQTLGKKVFQHVILMAIPLEVPLPAIRVLSPGGWQFNIQLR